MCLKEYEFGTWIFFSQKDAHMQLGSFDFQWVQEKLVNVGEK